MDSWMPIRKPMLKVLKENPNVVLVVFGDPFRWMKEIPAEQFEFHGWVDYAAYKLQRAVLNCEINLCPLVNTPFTQAKSAIRWYEGSLGPNPEAALAANVGPYGEEMEDGVTALLYDTPQEFYEKLTQLIKSKSLRNKLSTASRKWVLDNRTAEKTTPGLMQFFLELKAKQRREAILTP